MRYRFSIGGLPIFSISSRLVLRLVKLLSLSSPRFLGLSCAQAFPSREFKKPHINDPRISRLLESFSAAVTNYLEQPNSQHPTESELIRKQTLKLEERLQKLSDTYMVRLISSLGIFADIPFRSGGDTVATS